MRRMAQELRISLGGELAPANPSRLSTRLDGVDSLITKAKTADTYDEARTAHTSGYRVRAAVADGWPDEAPTTPTGTKPEIQVRARGLGSNGSIAEVEPEPPSNGSSDEGYDDTIRWHFVEIDDDDAERFGSEEPSRRKSVRRHAELEIEFDRETQLYTGLTQDISEGGVFIATYKIQPLGTPICLSFELPDGTMIVARGEVRWTRTASNASRPGMGVAFTEMSDESLAALARFCSRCAPLYVEV